MNKVCGEAKVILTGDVPEFATYAKGILYLEPGPEKTFHTYIFEIE
jgi:hypothetical protein